METRDWKIFALAIDWKIQERWIKKYKNPAKNESKNGSKLAGFFVAFLAEKTGKFRWIFGQKLGYFLIEIDFWDNNSVYFLARRFYRRSGKILQIKGQNIHGQK